MYQNSIDYVVKTRSCLGANSRSERERGGGGRGPDSSVVKAPASGGEMSWVRPGRAISNALKWYQWLPFNYGFSSPLHIVSLIVHI